MHDSLPNIPNFKLEVKEYTKFIKKLTLDVENVNTTADNNLKLLESELNKSGINGFHSDVKSLHHKIQKEKIAAIKRAKNELIPIIEKEIIRCYFPLSGQMEYDFFNSNAIKQLKELFSNKTKYNLLLNAE